MLIFFIIIALLIFSAFFSGSETGLTAASRAKIHKLKSEGSKRANKVYNLLKNKDRLITTILLGNNLVNIAASSLATMVALEYFGDEGVFIVTLLLTIIVLVFSEVLPKSYALKNPESVALNVSHIFDILIKILFPITFLIEKFVNLFIKLFKLEKSAIEELMPGEEALKGAIEMHHAEGDVVKEDKNMLGSILDMNKITVYDIMRHRKDMFILDINIPKEDMVKAVLSSNYTRIPLYSEDSDNIIGVIHVKDLMRHINHHCEGKLDNLNITDVMQEPWFVPERTSLKDQLLNFREKHSHFALVVDEYGSLQGLVTLEDILEEIVGEIEDEHDIGSEPIEITEEGKYIIEGSMAIRDLNRELDWNLPTEDAATLAGLIIQESEIIPEENRIFNYFGFTFRILKRENNQLKLIEVMRNL